MTERTGESGEAASAAAGTLSAAEALAASEARLAETEALRGRVSGRQWETVFRQMESALDALARSPIVNEDPEAQSRFRDLAGARDPEALALAFDHLAARVCELLEEIVAIRVAAGELTEAEAASLLREIGSGIHTRAPVETARVAAAAATTGGDGEGASRPARKRTVLRL